MPGRYYYAFDVTSFVQAEIKAADVDKGTLQLSLPSSFSQIRVNNTFKSLIIGDSNFSNSDYRIKLGSSIIDKKLWLNTFPNYFDIPTNVFCANAQNTYSPYSSLGLGEIVSSDYARTAGMGGVGIGIRNSNTFEYF